MTLKYYQVLNTRDNIFCVDHFKFTVIQGYNLEKQLLSYFIETRRKKQNVGRNVIEISNYKTKRHSIYRLTKNMSSIVAFMNRPLKEKQSNKNVLLCFWARYD